MNSLMKASRRKSDLPNDSVQDPDRAKLQEVRRNQPVLDAVVRSLDAVVETGLSVTVGIDHEAGSVLLRHSGED